MILSDIVRELSKGLGKVFLISSFIPTLLFIAFSSLLFADLVPPNLVGTLQNILKGTSESILGIILILVVTIFVLWLSFLIYSSASFIVKIFEGQFMPGKVREVFIFLKRKKHYKQTENYRKLLTIDKTKDDASFQEYLELLPSVRAELEDLESLAPIESDNLQPTSLGNISLASEIYPLERYGVDGKTLWPRLINILPSEFIASIKEQNAYLLFMLNSSLYTLLFGILVFIKRFTHVVNSSNLIWLGMSSFFISYFIYRLGTLVAIGYGQLIRTAFDLYRFDLLKKMHHPIPDNLEEEWGTWRAITEFCATGQRLGPMQFTYFAQLEENKSIAKLE